METAWVAACNTRELLKDFKQTEMWKSADQKELPKGSMEKKWDRVILETGKLNHEVVYLRVSEKLSSNNNHEIGVLEEGTAMEAERGRLVEKTG